MFHKYIRREPKPGGGYRYIYKESGSGRPARATRDKKSDKTTQDTPSEQDASPSKPQSESSKLRHKYLAEMQPLLKKKIAKTVEGGRVIQVGFTAKDNKHLYSDTFWRTEGFTKEDLKYLDRALAKSIYVKSAPGDPDKQNKLLYFHYFKDVDKELYYNVGLRITTDKDGVKHNKYVLYSVTNQLQSKKK